MAGTQVAPAPEQAAITIPAPTITAGWAVPAGQQSDAPKEAKEKPAKKRGIPAGPALAGAGNATAMGLTAAAEAGGLPALAAAGGVVALGTVAAVVRRRRQVRRRQAAAANRWSSVGGGGSRTGSWGGSGGGSWGGSGSGSRGSAAGGSRTSSAGSPWRASTGSAGSAGGGSRAGSGSSAGGGSRGSGTGTTSAGSGRQQVRDRRDGSGSGGSQKTSKAKPSATQRAAKTAASHAGRAASGAARMVGAGTAKAWKTSKPLRTKAWSATKHAGRKARGLTADALRALRTGVWGTIRHWSIKKGLGKAWAAWKQHRANRKNKQTGIDLTKPERTISSVVRKPTNQISRTVNGGILMPGHHFTGPAMEMARAASAYEPTGMLQVGADFAGLQEGLELVAEAMRVTVDKADAQHPLHPQIVELMKQIHGLQLKASELAAELQPAFKNLHQVDIARLENPRKGIAGERMWDISNNLS